MPEQRATWWTRNRFEGLARRTSEFASGPWGSHVAFGLLAFWLGASLVVGWTSAYALVDEFATMVSFLLLFLLQRAQAKDSQAMQVKLNELLAAVHQASPLLINLEDRSESEVKEIHDLFRRLQTGPGESHSIDEVRAEVEQRLEELEATDREGG